MFVDLTYLHLYDNEFDDEEPNEDDVEEPWVISPPMLREIRITTNL